MLSGSFNMLKNRVEDDRKNYDRKWSWLKVIIYIV
jgi:hypothetical protein